MRKLKASFTPQPMVLSQIAVASGGEQVTVQATNEQLQHGLRILTALCIAPVVTIGLLLLMNELIDGNLPEPEVIPPITFSEVFNIPKEIDPPPEEDEADIQRVPPPPIPLRVSSIELKDSISIASSDFGVEPVEGIGQLLSDSDAPVRLVVVAPDYPMIATSRNIEGYVDIRFDVTKAGTTENLEILAYEPSTVFNRSVLRAVARWRYQPRLAKGEPIATKGVMERVSFKMEY